MSVKLFAVLTGVVSIFASAAAAEDWSTPAWNSAASYATDLDSLARKGDVVQSWMRETLVGQKKDPVSGKFYATVVTQRYDDCEGRRFGWGTFVRRSADGLVTSSGNAPGGWTPIVPGSIGESVWRLNCTATTSPKEKALWPQLNDGQWTSLGESADKKYNLYVALDRVLKLDGGRVITLTRTDYASAQMIDGFPVRYILSATVVDCNQLKIATLGSDLYISPKIRIESLRSDAKSLNFETAAPGSFAFANMDRICGAGVSIPKQASAPSPSPTEAISAGTAWAVSKGYLVTAQHVVADARTITLYRNGERVGVAKVVASDPANDLAVLKPLSWHGGKLVALPVASHGAELGKSVFTLGYPEPGDLGQRVKMTAGQVSSTAGFQDDARYVQVSIPIQPGNSGGPVIGWDGSVVGVVEAKLTRFSGQTESPPEMVNYALKSSYLRPILEDLPDLSNYITLKPSSKADDLVAQARRAVFMLIATH